MMNLKFLVTSSALALVLGTPIALPRAAIPVGPTIPFDAVSMTIEVNATDDDAGVILFSDTEERLHHLTIRDPSGNVVYEMTSSDGQGLGLTEISSETAEPDIKSAFLAYPEGNYTLIGEAFDGTIVTGVAHLSHSVPEAPQITQPADGDQLAIDHVQIKWGLDGTVDHYWIELEQEDPPVNFTIQLQPGVHKFTIPDQVLRKASTYHVGVGAVGSNGNATVSEVEFDTK
jgi:hypothetical protein